MNWLYLIIKIILWHVFRDVIDFIKIYDNLDVVDNKLWHRQLNIIQNIV